MGTIINGRCVPETLSELRENIHVIYEGVEATIPKSWLLRTNRRDVAYLEGCLKYSSSILDHLCYLGEVCCAASLQEKAGPVVGMIRNAVPTSLRARFSWLVLHVVYEEHMKDAVVSDRKARSLYRKETKQLVLVIDTLRCSPSVATRTPLGELQNLLQTKYPNLVADLEDLVSRAAADQRVFFWALGDIPRQVRQYTGTTVAALMAMEDMLGCSQRRVARFLYELFESLGVTLGDPSNPDKKKAIESLRTLLSKWGNED